jgi:UDP-4-amino-4,6-dideoxy-N-acetyl-beta-L-altrosamine transaminase
MTDTANQRFLPYGRQTIEADDIEEVVAALRSDYLTTGPRVDAFEQAFATATGAPQAIACNSGTAALHLAALALDLLPGDAAIVPAMTFLATATVVRMCGAEVVFADVDPQTGLLTADTFEASLARARAVGLRVRAVFPVHLNGQLCDRAAIAAIAAREGVTIVEDSCHALGIANVGAAEHGGLACFSTHPVKAIATGEGGVVTTADATTAKRLRALRSHGMIRDAAQFVDREAGVEDGRARPWYYEMQEVGWNYRMPDLLCALGISQLRKLSRFHGRRVELARTYDALLAPLAPHIVPVGRRDLPHGWHLYAVLIDFAELGLSRMRVMQALAAQGIGTQVHYIPVHRQPYYVTRYGALSLPGADAYYERCLSLPLFPSMGDDEVVRVASALASVCDHA